ncbi:MAG: DUF547 domain-containing protein [Bacteroidota bacterium]
MSYIKFFTLLSILASVLLIGNSCSAPNLSSTAQPINHASWDSLLRQHVDEYGLVNYQAMLKDSNALNAYLDLLSKNAPNTKSWTEAEQMAYWINAYNAFTIKIILDHYPVKGIKDIKNGVPFVNSVWDIKFFKIADEEFDLNNIEHGILRKKFDDPRIHFALVCASMSCPKLQKFAFTAEQLDAQLEQASREFFNDSFRNKINDKPIRLSKILSWYWMDFKGQYDGRYALINRYTDLDVSSEEEIDFLDYNWELNEQTVEKIKQIRGQ